MNCPEHYILSSKYLTIIHWQHADIRREFVTWLEVLNPLRYELTFRLNDDRRWTWNDDAWQRLKWSNFWFHVRQGCWFRGHDFKINSYSKNEICQKCYKHSKEPKSDG